MCNVKHVLNRFEPQRRLAVGLCRGGEQATLTVLLYPGVGTARKYAKEQNHGSRLDLALLVQTSINVIEESWKGGTMDDMVDVVDVLNKFFQEYLSFWMLWQPDTSGWLKFRGRERILADVWLRLLDLLD